MKDLCSVIKNNNAKAPGPKCKAYTSGEEKKGVCLLSQ